MLTGVISAILPTLVRKHVDLRSLPSLVPPLFMNATAQAVNAELVARIRRLQDMIDSGVLEFDYVDGRSVD